MVIEKVTLDWLRGQQFLLQDRAGLPIVAGQPAGAKAADLLPLSLIGCAAWDVVGILQKQRQQVTSLQISAESERDQDPPWRFRKIHVLYKFTGRDLSAELIQRAIELSETKYCSVYATLREVVEITSSFEIQGE